MADDIDKLLDDDDDIDDLLEDGSNELEESEPEKKEPNDDIDLSEGSDKKKGLSKALLIKIAIGLVVVLIAAGAGYYFLGTTDDQDTPDDSAELVDEQSEENKDIAQDEEDMSEDALESDESSMTEDEVLEEEMMADEDASIDLPELPEMPEDEELDEAEQGENDLDLPSLPGDTESGTSEIDDALASDAASLQPALNQLDVPVIKEQTSLEQEAEALLALERQKEVEALAAKIKAERYKNIFEEETRPDPWTRKPKTQAIPEAKWGEFERASSP